MALVADNLAFFGHHGVAALGTGIKKLLGLIDRGILFELPAEIEERGKGRDNRLFGGVFFIHKASLSWCFGALNFVFAPSFGA
jgi:hypothetical protein